MLVQQLRQLEADGLLRRTVHAQVPPRVEYTLTEPGRKLLPILDALDAWAGALVTAAAPVRVGEPT